MSDRVTRKYLNSGIKEYGHQKFDEGYAIGYREGVKYMASKIESLRTTIKAIARTIDDINIEEDQNEESKNKTSV